MVAKVESYSYWYCGCQRKRGGKGWTPEGVKTPLTSGTTEGLDRCSVERNETEEEVKC